MISLIGDSVWDLNSIMSRPAKKQKTEPKDKKKEKKKK